MPSYLDFDSTKNFRDALLAKTLQSPNGPQTFGSTTYSVQNTNNLANRDQGDVTVNDQTTRTNQLSQTESSNRFGPENSEYEIIEQSRVLIDQGGNVGAYPYFPTTNNILGRSLIGTLNSENLEFESKLERFAHYYLTEAPDGPINARLQQNLYTATYGRVRLLDALEGNLSTAVNIVRGRENLVEKNFKITVAKTLPGKAIDFLQTVAGVEFPWTEIPGDYLTNPANPIVNRPTATTELGKIWQDATGALGSLLGIQRRPTASRKPSDLMIEYLSDGQKDALYNNLSFSKYAPNYTLKARSQNTSKLFSFVDSVATGINKLLGREAPEGKAYIGDDRGNNVENILQDFNQNKVLSPYYLSLLFDSTATELFSIEKNISERGSIGGNLTWYSKNSQNKLGANNLEYGSEKGSLENSLSNKYTFRDDSILGKTQALLNTLPKNGGESRSHVANVIDQTSRIFREGNKIMSRGSAIKYVDNVTGKQDGTEYCRVWTKDRAYMNYSDTMKRTGTIRKIDDSVLSTPWNLNIAPMSNGSRSFNGSTNIDPGTKGPNGKDMIGGKAKKYMFSIENLAWKTSNKPGYTYNDLPMCERGANGGRVMWFPPYDLKVNENNTASWDKNSFLGRPEPIYTYQNTERSGTISFKVVVDHPSILNLLIKEISDEEAENFLNSFFAGCHEVDFYSLIRKYTTLDQSDLQLIIAYLDYYKNGKTTDTTTDVLFRNIAGESTTTPGTTIVPDPKTQANEGLPRVEAMVYFPNDIPGPNTDIYSSQDYGQIYTDYISKKDEHKRILGTALNDILTGKTKNDESDRIVLFNSADPTEKGTKTLQSLIDAKKAQLETGFNKLSSEFSQMTEGAAKLKAELEKNNAKDIQVVISSSTSFVADDKYNIKLSYRRANAVAKHIIKSLAKNQLSDAQVNSLFKWKKTAAELNSNPTVMKENQISIPLKDLGYGDDSDQMINFNITNYGENNERTEVNTIANLDEKYDCHKTEIKNKTGLKKFAPITFYCRAVKFEMTYTTKTNDNKEAQKTTPSITEIKPGKTNIEVIKNEVPRKPPLDVVKLLIMKTLSECFYFKKLEETDPVVFGSLKEKLRYFHPAFHSMTPEGLNSRLTFLHQCIRPGDTIPVKKLGTDVNGTVLDARNTTFGPPPVCVLRIGDFYHSKIVITNMNITYENSTWDLNPEGIGVQPMIADVTLQVNFIGGQGIKEPVAKLQNALSSNFYANTEVYDYRADVTAGSINQSGYTQFNIDFLEKLTGNLATKDIAKIDTNPDDKTTGKFIGVKFDTDMNYTEPIITVIRGTNDYFDAFKKTYELLSTSYSPQILPLFISPTYRTVNQLDVQSSLSSTTPVNLLGKYKKSLDFTALFERLEKSLTDKVSSSDHNAVFNLGFDSGTSKYERSRDIIDPFVKTAVAEFLNKIREEKAPAELEGKRNIIVQAVDELNFIVKTNGKDAQIKGDSPDAVELTNFDASKFYGFYSSAIDLIDNKHKIFTDGLDTSIDFTSPSFSDDTYKNILAFIIKDSVSKIKTTYSSSKDKNFFDDNTLDTIEKRLNKFVKHNLIEVKKHFKYKNAEPKKTMDPYPYSATTLDSTETELLNKIHATKDVSDETKLNFLKANK